MRLAFIGSSFPPYISGVSINAAAITSGIAAAGHQIGVFIPDYPKSAVLASGLVNPAVTIFPLPSLPNRFKTNHRFISPFNIRKSLLSALVSFKPDIIHLHEPSLHFFSPLRSWANQHHLPIVCAHLFPPSFITSQFGLHFPLFDSFAFNLVISLYNQTNLVITPTHTMSDLLQAQGLTVPVQVISCGVDTAKFAPNLKSPVQPPVILFLGRISPEKHLEMLSSAAPFINHSSQIWVAGTGKNYSPLPHLKYLGPVPEDQKPDLYRQATIFVMPGTAESQSIASLEAAASGLPLILANAAALSELIEPKRPNGLLFEPNNPQDLAAKINLLLSNPPLWQTMSTSSRRLALKHDFQNTINQYLATYFRLLKK